MNAQNVILASMSATAALTIVDDLANSDRVFPSAKLAFGGLATTIGLLLFSEVEPGLATGFAILIVTATLFSPKSQSLFNLVDNLAGTKAPKATPVKTVPNTHIS